ncbi:hypothetical protein TSOC_012859, partial [Tetrabaena socialis]
MIWLATVLAAFVLANFAASDSISSIETFIVPLLWHGPNNQITTLKEGISLALLLNVSVLLPDTLLSHKFSDGGPDLQLVTNELFDVRLLRAAGVAHSFISGAEQAGGWNRTLDALLYFRDEPFPAVTRMLDAMGLKAPPMEHWLRSPISVTRGCSHSHIRKLGRMLRPYRYVGMLCYDDFTLQTHKLAGTLLSDCGADACCQAYKEGSVALRHSLNMLDLAGSFVRQYIGADTPFLAVHIRPMPDPCVELWRQPQEELSEREMEDTCRTDFMLDRFVPNVRALQAAFNLSRVFVMTHPTIRPRVFRMLRAAGIQPIYMDMKHLATRESPPAGGGGPATAGGGEPAPAGSDNGGGPAPLARSAPSFSLLAMVEEAVAAAATVFLGTAESSMTGMVVQ